MTGTWDAVVTTSLNIERDEISAKSSRWIVSKQVNGDLVSDEPIKLLYRLTTETTQQRVDAAVWRHVQWPRTIQQLYPQERETATYHENVENERNFAV